MSSLRKILGVLVAAALIFAFAPAVLAQDVTPSVTVVDQDAVEGTVTIDEVVSPGPGWIVIHADDNGQPGEVIGYAAVDEGTNEDVAVEIDTEMATPTLHAMLHEDAGTVGTYEFPGDDGPVTVDDIVVIQTFTVTALEAEVEEEAQEPVTPALTVTDQEVMDGTVVVDEVDTSGPGWVVIHADEGGQPGPVIGQTAVDEGTSTDVEVEIDTEMATETLYAMLHEDTGTVGTFEFPDADPPAEDEGEVVVTAFTVTDFEAEAEAEAQEVEEEETMLPAAGGPLPWGWLALILVGITFVALGLRLSAQKVRVQK